jgi:hypothetical protein
MPVTFSKTLSEAPVIGDLTVVTYATDEFSPIVIPLGGEIEDDANSTTGSTFSTGRQLFSDLLLSRLLHVLNKATTGSASILLILLKYP